MQGPKISIIVPIYNVEPYLRKCLDSIIGQTYRNLEVILVDDGSTDGSPVILASYAGQDDRIQVVTQANAGPGAARNTGFALANGQYVIFLDSDDWFEPDFLAQMLLRAQSTGADITICRAVEFDTKTGRELPSEWMLKEGYLPSAVFSPEDIAAHIFQFTYGWPWDKLYRMDFVRGTGLSYPALPTSEDLVFIFQSLALANKIAVLNKTLVHHRVNRLSSVSNARRLEPEALYQSLSLLREGLRQRGVYPAFEHSFLNWAMEFLMWNAANMGERRAQRLYFQKLKREWLPRMGFERHPSSYYENRSDYAKYLLVKHAPYLVFSAVLAVYRAWKREGACSDGA